MRRSSEPCCPCCSMTSRRRRTRTPACWLTGGCPTRWVTSPWYLRTLRDEGKVADRLAYLLGTSRYVADLLVASPDALALLADDRAAATAFRRRDRRGDGGDGPAGQTDLGAAIRSVRAVRRTELVRIACADLLGLADTSHRVAGLSATMDATITAALELVMAQATAAAGLASRRSGWRSSRWVVSAGTRSGTDRTRTSCSSTSRSRRARATPRPEAGAAGQRGCGQIRGRGRHPVAVAAQPTGGDPPVQIDANLRPGGTRRAVGALAGLLRRATTRAGPRPGRRRRCCGPARRAADAELGRRFVELIDPLRYPVRRTRTGRGTRDPPSQGRASTAETVAARRRPGHPHQAGPRRPRRRRVDDPAAAAAARPRPAGAAHDRDGRRPARSRPDSGCWSRRTSEC